MEFFYEPKIYGGHSACNISTCKKIVVIIYEKKKNRKLLQQFVAKLIPMHQRSLSTYPSTLKTGSTIMKESWVRTATAQKQAECQATPLLETFVHHFMAPDICLKRKFLLISCEHPRSLHFGRGFSGILLISFSTLVFLEEMLDCQTKNLEIWPISARQGPLNPDNVSTSDPNTNFIPESWTSELVGKEPLPMGFDVEIRPVDGGHTVVPHIILPAVLPHNLYNKVMH